MVRVRVHSRMRTTPDQRLSELQLKVCRLRVYLVSFLNNTTRRAGFTRVPRTRWEAVASFLDIKEPFQSPCSIPTEQALQLGSGGAWRCALLEAALLACVISPFTCCFEFYLN